MHLPIYMNNHIIYIIVGYSYNTYKCLFYQEIQEKLNKN